MYTLVRIVIVVLIAVSLFMGIASDVLTPEAFSNGHFPYWWSQATAEVHDPWNRLERAYGPEVSR
jgi:hypothetical protein